MNARNENSVTTSLGELRQLEHARLAAERSAREEQRAREAAVEQRAREAAVEQRAREAAAAREEERHREATRLAAAEARRAAAEAELRTAEVRARAAAAAVTPTSAATPEAGLAPGQVRPRVRWLGLAMTSTLAVAALVVAVGLHQRASAAERRARAAHAQLAELRAALDAAAPATTRSGPALAPALLAAPATPPAPAAAAAPGEPAPGKKPPKATRPRPSAPPALELGIDPVHTLGDTKGQ
ncbi:MAG: hypothetical protein IT370_15405 [Deltaproteobacteria bacterium]|nr:hypothetical protein [Deltaproteobacteria bacterium]